MALVSANTSAIAPDSPGVPILAGGIDWLGCTAPDGNPARDLWYAGRCVVEEERRCGYVPRATKVLGYTGFATTHAFVGRRPDGVYVRLSGSTANEWWRDVLVHAQNVPRIDLQATVHIDPESDSLALGHWLEACEAPARRGRPLSAEVRISNDTGQTFYLGRRQSDAYGRCYDKHAQDPEKWPAGAWRYEVEFHNDAAGAVAGRLADCEAPTTTAVSTVRRWFSARGCHPVIPFTVGEVATSFERDPTTTERQLRWLLRQVAPTMTDLAKRGHAADVASLVTSALDLALN